jgi:hypothetical protein
MTDEKRVTHTPGPWRIEEKEMIVYMTPNHHFPIKTPGAIRAGDTFDKAVCTLPEGGMRNARLIAAAPELLEAVKMAFQLSCDRSETGRKWTSRDQTVHELLKAVLSKAEGMSV